jgi:hypothetical protein
MSPRNRPATVMMRRHGLPRAADGNAAQAATAEIDAHAQGSVRIASRQSILSGLGKW